MYSLQKFAQYDLLDHQAEERRYVPVVRGYAAQQCECDPKDRASELAGA